MRGDLGHKALQSMELSIPEQGGNDTMLEVTIQLKTPAAWKTRLRPYCKTVRETCESAIAATKLAKYDCQWSMAVVLADDAFIKKLNRDYRGKNKATNVLSFPSEPDIERNAKTFSRQGEYELGDIILAYETILREATEQKKSFTHHARHLLVHGTLHLLGYDHMEQAQAQAMEKLEIKILKKQNIDNPYLSA